MAESNEGGKPSPFRSRPFIGACAAAAVVLLVVAWLVMRHGPDSKRVAETRALLEEALDEGLHRAKYLALVENLGGKRQAIARLSELLGASLKTDPAEMGRYAEELKKGCPVKDTAAKVLGYCGREAIPELCRALKSKDPFACAGALDGVELLEEEGAEASPPDLAGIEVFTPILADLVKNGAHWGIQERAKEVLSYHNGRLKSGRR